MLMCSLHQRHLTGGGDADVVVEEGIGYVDAATGDVGVDEYGNVDLR